MNYSQELTRLRFAKRVVKFFPDRIKFRAAKFLYNYQSERIKGFDIVVPYLHKYNYALRFSLNTKELIGWNIFFFGEYEPYTNKILKACLKEGDFVLEAGANNGSETILISKLIGTGMIYAFEPIPHIFQKLKTNIELNDLQSFIQAFDIALGEEDKMVEFNLLPKDFPNQGMSSKYMTLAEKLPVQQKTLDSWAREQNLKQLHLIKMDIQGAEIDLLTGGKETISKFRPIIFTEADKEWNSTQKLYDALTNLGYNTYLIKGGKLELQNPSGIIDGNWLAIHKQTDFPESLKDILLK